MAPRNIFHGSPSPEFHNIHLSNTPNANPQRHFENTMLGSNEHTILNSSVDFSHLNTATSGAIWGSHRHPVFAVGSGQNMTYQTQNVPYCYSEHTNGTRESMVHPPAENSRVAFKRKTPAHPVHEIPYGHQFSGSSPNFPVPPNHFQLKSVEGCSRPLHPNGSVHWYQDDTLLSTGEGYQRNIRIRHNNALRADLKPAWQSLSSRPTQLFYSSANISTPTVVGQWHHTTLPGTYAQWNHPTTSDVGCSNYLMDQSVSRNSVFGGATEQNNAWNLDHSRNSYATVNTPHGSDYQGTWANPSSYDQGQVHNRTSSSYSNLAASAGSTASEGTGPSGTGSVALSRIPRPTAFQNSFTNRVLRNFNAGRPAFISRNAPHGWTSHALSMTDVPPFAYALDLFDEHRDLRVDIDNMSYEELLVLEERIGSVNTGLAEDHLSRCLTERMYCSSASAQDEASCPICLEEFKDEDSQGVMKCHHVYHVTCIKHWLGLKKTCPVCKSPALDNDMKQKQKFSL